MTSITIRNVPEDLRDDLAGRAASSGQSLQEYLLGQLTALGQRPDINAVLARARERKAVSGARLPARRILALRDRGRP